MNSKLLTTSTGENIFILDDVFPIDQTQEFQVFAEKSMYVLGSSASEITDHLSKNYFQSVYSPTELESFGIFNGNNYSIFEPYIQDRKLNYCWMLASTYLTKYYMHTDKLKTSGGKTFLYYVNNKWESDWGGETMFANSHGDLEIAVSMKPNRVVIFDSHIPHKPAPTNVNAPSFRFTFVAQFTK